MRIPRPGSSSSAMPFNQETEDLLEYAKSDIQRLREREERKACHFILHTRFYMYVQLGISAWKTHPVTARKAWGGRYMYMYMGVVSYTCMLR